MTTPTGWALLHSPLPKAALKPLGSDVYGVSGLTDVNEGFLIERLWQSRLPWEWVLDDSSYCGSEERTPRGKNYSLTWYLAHVRGTLVIEGRRFSGAGGHDNRKLDAAFKGAATVAFKNACKAAGLTTELYKGGQMRDVVHEGDSDGGGRGGGDGAENVSAPRGRPGVSSTPAPSSPPQPPEHVHEDIPTNEQLEELYRLARELPGEHSRNHVYVDDKVRRQGAQATLRQVKAAHIQLCGGDCDHLGPQQVEAPL